MWVQVVGTADAAKPECRGRVGKRCGVKRLTSMASLWVGCALAAAGCGMNPKPISSSPAPSGDYVCRVQTSGKSGMLVSDEYEVAVGGGAGRGNWRTVLSVNHSAPPSVEWLNDRTVAIHFDDGGGLGVVRSTVYAQRPGGARELVRVRLRPRLQPSE